MRIISNKKDYYDSAQAYGQDQSVIYKRNTKALLKESKVSEILIMLKDPDGVYEDLIGLPEDLRRRIIEKWFAYGEYANIAINLETLEAEVVPCSSFEDEE